MVFINEFLPNPLGSDAEGEWVELFNDGPAPMSLSGWVLVTKGGKEVALSGKTIGAGEYLLLPRTGTKLTLHNTDGALALYDTSGNLADEAQFLGTAPEGKGFARRDFGAGEFHFAFTDPTPGAKNVITDNLALITNNYSFGQPLNAQLGLGGIFGLMFGAAAVIAGLIIFVLIKNENLQKLFFKRDAEIR